jgi:hypothetical protein
MLEAIYSIWWRGLDSYDTSTYFYKSLLIPTHLISGILIMTVSDGALHGRYKSWPKDPNP